MNAGRAGETERLRRVFTTRRYTNPRLPLPLPLPSPNSLAAMGAYFYGWEREGKGREGKEKEKRRERGKGVEGRGKLRHGAPPRQTPSAAYVMVTNLPSLSLVAVWKGEG